MMWKLSLAFWLAISLLPAQAEAPATIHFYRYRLTVGTAAHPTISCDDFPVARIQNGRVYTMKISKGRHAFTTGDNPTGITVDIEAGKEYFVRLDYPQNSLSTHTTPVLVAPAQGREEIRKLRPLDGNFVEAATCGRP